MLMTKFKFEVVIKEDGAYTAVDRLFDGATKTFFQAGIKDPKGIESFMSSITDELADTYFPKHRKK